MQAIDLLTIGDSCIDQLMKIGDDFATEEGREICFMHGTKIPVDTFETSIAGNALNVSVGTQKLGIKTGIYTEIGEDENACRIIEELQDHGVDTTFCIKNKGTLTDIHPIVIYKKDRTIFIYHEKRNHKVQKWAAPKWIYYSSIGKDFEKFQKELCDYIKSNPSIGVFFNPGTFHLKKGLEAIRNFLEVTDILILNKEEAEMLVGKASIEDTHTKLQQLGPKLTVVTDGPRGASAFDGKHLEIVPIFEEKKPVIDATGAGDAFSAGFLAGIINNRPLREAVSWGIINSSGVIREYGAINGLRSRKEIEGLLEK